ncbi:hypothetical protein [Sphingomonas paucimobilis]|uniref:hypothetical protein n=1 Tax=Sphingomonas paucimobilis TaxID=13689 RepID=UPI00064B831E|nr:hypothetical protein [Sphingomonas paucimobilis]
MTGHDVIAIKGPFTVRAASARRIRKHDRFAQAESAALRLAEANPGVTFVICQEVAQVTPARGIKR